ncbi:Triple QxxK/R motif-containing protein [Trichoplax sp. H2]|nr:Triple QxxK/R motif-containing protein [Trichoplax sp. H2]|eukprot:RDD43089.1 Triple QxxK/R motif-containing protein [Trichoplax sp. H2]
MGRKDIANSTPIQQYRQKLGEQEFKGRNKRNTLATREKAQARRSSNGIQALFAVVGGLFVLLLAVYFIFYLFINK